MVQVPLGLRIRGDERRRDQRVERRRRQCGDHFGVALHQAPVAVPG